MKKVILPSIFVLISIFAFSQSKLSKRTQIFPDKKSGIDLKSEIKPSENEKVVEQVIWQDDFSTAANWIISNKTTDNQNWVITTLSSTTAGYNTGTWKSQADVSDENGYALFDSDAIGSDGGIQNADITIKDAINLSAYPNVAIQFRQRVKLWYSTVTNLQVSADGGTTWTTFDVNYGRPVSTAYEENVNLNISAAAGGASNVKIRFNYVGSWDYLWSIDDVKLVVSLNNELVLNTTWLDFEGGGYARGYYSNIPMNQEPIISLYRGAILNNGVNNQTNVGLDIIIDDNNSTVHTFLADTILPISATGIRDTIYSAKANSTNSFFIPDIKIASYNVNYYLTQDQPDENLLNNTSQLKFNVTDTVFARDFVYNSSTGPSRYSTGKDGDRVGVIYYIEKAQQVSSISVFIPTYTDIGTSFIGKIFISDGTNLQEIVSTNLRIITADDLGKWISVGFIKDGTSEFIDANQEIYVSVECYFQGIGDFYVGADNSIFQTMNKSYLYLEGGDYYLDVMPMVRLNVESSLCSVYISSKTDVSCTGTNDGSAVASVDNCAAPYTFEWSNGETTNVILGLTAGNYTVTVTDANSMISVASVTIFEFNSSSKNDTITYYVSNSNFETKSPLSIFDKTDSLISVGGCDSIINHYSKFVYQANHCTDLISVYDTLKINVVITELSAPNNINLIKVFPNPTNEILWINCGDFSKMNNYTLKIRNSLSQEIWSTIVNQSEYSINLSTFGSSGVYFLEIYDSNSIKIEVKKIVLQ